MADIETTWWEKTDRPLVWRDNIGSPVYRCLSTGEERDWTELPVGALTWSNDPVYQRAADSLSVQCILPDRRTWYIDGKANNCTNPERHQCWHRTGTIGDRLTVTKGEQCPVGAGSILTPNYHGFLRDGKLTNA